MKNIPQISESELILMHIIWQGGGTALYADIMDELARQGLQWKKNTVLTFLSRLVDKGMLSTSKIGRRNEYGALVGEGEYQADQTRQLVDRVYGGNIHGLVNMLVRGDLASDADIEALRRMWQGEDHT